MTTTTPDGIADLPREERAPARFAEAVANLRTKATTAEAERWFRLAGPVFIPLGALMIVLGWWGAANTTRVFLQIPYLISGGLLGLGFMFVGGFAYFARWMTDLLQESRQRAETAEENAAASLAALERMEGLLAAYLGTEQAWAAEESDVPTLVATTSGRLAHLTDCRLVDGRDTVWIDADDAPQWELCRICLPEGL